MSRTTKILLLGSFILVFLISCKSNSSGDETTLYDVSVSISPSGAGTISPSADSSYESNQSVNLQAQPNSDYIFTGWSGSVESSQNPLSITVDKPYGLTAQFELKSYALEVSTQGNGMVAEQILPAKNTDYNTGTLVELIAIPNADSSARFVEWQGDVTGTSNPVQITVDAPKQVTAIFETKSYPLTVLTEGQGTVAEQVVTAKVTDYTAGDIVELTATPATGWQFARWEGDWSSTSNPTQVTVDGPKTVKAIFVQDTQSTNFYDVSVSVSPTAAGTISPAADSSYEQGQTIQLEALAESGYVFAGWSGSVESTQNPLQFTVDKAYGLTAHFELIEYDLTINIQGQGNVTEQVVKAKTTSYATGSLVELYAIADVDNGYSFVEWQGDLTGSTNPVRLTVDSPKTVTVVFQKDLFYSGNGITVECPNAQIGDVGYVFGKAFTKRSVDQITPENATNTCTSGITDMSSLFSLEYTFNGNISSWDVSTVTTMASMFSSATAFNQDLRAWDVSNVTDMSNMFIGAQNFTQDISDWDVSSVINMNGMFRYASAFNQDLSNWNVGAVTDMSYMFASSSIYNQPLGSWDISSVTDMSYMFNGATAFNQNLNTWNVSSVTNMLDMFDGATNFNGDISAWDVSSVTSMSSMFRDAISFNQDLSAWNVSSVTSLRIMFNGATAFNQSLNTWNVSSVFSFDNMFKGATSFNGDISSWNVSSATDMKYMFDGASSFDQNLSAWNVSSVTNMSYMFRNATAFNQNLPSWNVGNVTTMQSMFQGASLFNGDLSGWNPVNVGVMNQMFDGASSFNQDLGAWDVSSVIAMAFMFNNATLFNQDLSGWCVSNITTEPFNFSTGSSLTEVNKPVWGTCPAP